MKRTNHFLIRIGLLANAAFSLASGLLFSVASSTVGGWIDVDIDAWLRLFGIALLLHSAILLWAVRRPDADKWTKLNLVAIAPYPLLMVIVVLGGLVNTGQALVLIDGAVVGACAVLQWSGLRGISNVPNPRLA